MIPEKSENIPGRTWKDPEKKREESISIEPISIA
jgi:hypothetical protein